MTTTYTDASGITYRAVGRMPYSELTPNTRFALPWSPAVYVKGERGRPGATGQGWLDTLLVGAYHGTTVIVLEADTSA